MIGGVCGGMGAALGIDPLWLRLAFILLAAGPGIGVGLYILLWILLPTEASLGASRRDVVQGNVNDLRDRAVELGQKAQETFSGARSPWGERNQNLVLIGAALVGLGLVALLSNLGLLWWANIKYLGPLMLVVLGAAILIKNLKDA
jgi:phage shock protein PspC (stress-responsive transcriptional regulator)